MADLAIQDHESSSQDTLGTTLTDTITVVNNGPGEATGVDLTDALDAAAQVMAIEPGPFTCSTGAAVQCSLAELAPGASESLEVHVRPLRPGQLIDDVTASDDEFDPNYANDSAKTDRHRHAQRHRGEGADRARSDRSRLRGHVVGFVVTVGVTKPVPGVKPTVCVTLPKQLRVTVHAPGRSPAPAVCAGTPTRSSTAHHERSASPRASCRRPLDATLAVRARLTGANFAASRAAAAVQVPPRPVVACPSRAGPGLAAGIAC